jgi:EmrB/QacA subfamily drug resistance transporter
MAANGVGLRSERGPILIALMLSMSLVAIDSTIIATAVPSVVASIGGFSSFPWLFSVYVLAQAVSVPVYGKLADLFGRKPIMLLGIGLFLVGSILCGVAWSMGALIAFRVVQGLGAGAVSPMTMTIAGDIYTIAERAKTQGYLASVWAISSVLGPSLGGVFAEYISWRWIFFVNIPICLLAAAMIYRNFHEKVEHRRVRIDYLGAGLLTGGSTLVILAVLEGGQSWAWSSAAGLIVPAVGVAMLALFVVVERRTPEPVLPLWVFGRRLLVTTSLVAVGVGGILLGLTSYVPTYVQDVLGTGPLVAGLAVGALTLGWPLSASQAGRIYTRIGFRNCAFIGAAVATLGCLLLTLLNGSSSIAQVAGTCFVIGLGMGLVAVPTLIAAQSSVGWSDRGVVTATNMFCRSTGSAVGVAIFGAIANATIGHNIPTAHPTGAARAALLQATDHVFVGVVVVAALLLIGVLLMPKGSHTPAAEQAADVKSAAAEAIIA